jgi:hypothetical protein
MADWDSLCAYARSNYAISDDRPDRLFLDFQMEDGRTRRVGVMKCDELAGTEWAEILTVVCTESDISARDALVKNSQMFSGALDITETGLVVFRYAVPLDDLDTSEFDRPVTLIANVGDYLEGKFTGCHGL